MQISLRDARKLIVQSQLLSGKPSGSGPDHTISVIEQLGYVQIDTISVIARAHHHVLWSRIPRYQESYLKELERKREVFQYWSHAASYLPMRDYKYALITKGKIRQGKGHWRSKDKKVMKFVHDRIKAEGPLMSKDFEKDSSLNENHAWGGHPIKSALHQLFMEGDLMIAGRQGFQKVFDLTDRILPDGVDTKAPTMAEYYKYVILRDLRAHGLLKSSEVGHLLRLPKKEMKSLISELEEDGIIMEVEIKGLKSDPYFALRDTIEAYSSSRSNKKLQILSPFDNLVIQRKRLQELFSLEYTLECYVPAAKRKVGYFSLPLLFGHEFVGQIDLKADRKRQVLVVKNLLWQENVKQTDKLRMEFLKSLHAFREFNGCDVIEGLAM